MTIAEKILHAISEHSTSLKNRQFSVTASIGIVDIDQSHEDVATLLETADQACYASKRSGGNKITVAELL